MNKDVIYIDADDDVTAIIGKIKKSKEKIVAVVPPKRSGTLQSAVNLRLLDRMAKNSNKQLVLITSNPGLVALAATASIPVAKNLQTKPEIAEVAAIIVDDGDDIIDGADLPIGDHANTIKVKDGTRPTAASGRSDAIDSIDIDGESDITDALSTLPAAGNVTQKSASTKSKIKIPNFDSFRKKLFFSLGGGVLLVALLVWMFVFAPSATVIVTAATSPSPVSSTIKLGGTAATDFNTGTVRSLVQSEKKDETIEFDATGQKDLGTPATGTVTFSTNSISALGTVIPAGTRLTTISGSTFLTNAAVTMTLGNSTGANVGVTATGSGTSFNGATGNVSGTPSGINGTISTATSGGTSNIVKVVSADDIDRATGQLIGKSPEAEKIVLAKKFVNGEKVIDSSFSVERAAAVSAPALDAEAASGKATLTIAATYTMHAIAVAELESYLNSSLKAQLADTNSQKVYNNGVEKAALGNFRSEAGVLTVSLTTTAQIGPKIDEADIKEQVKGKIYGEVQSTLQRINGIKEVDVQFSYFWVRTVPSDNNNIDVQFKIENE